MDGLPMDEVVIARVAMNDERGGDGESDDNRARGEEGD